MKVKVDDALRRALAVSAICFVLASQFVWAQNLGTQPQTNVAVQGQTAAQPEGAFLNFINWIGNVIAPVGAGGAVVGAVVSWLPANLRSGVNSNRFVEEKGKTEQWLSHNF